jgi:Pseudomurein-binding repeat/T5orf172 domain
MDEKLLCQVQVTIEAKKVTISEDEARDLAKRALQFKMERGRLPDINSADAWEKRMAVAEYKLHNLNRVKIENLFHKLFAAAQLDLMIEDRFGNPVKPREWFLVPLHVIDEAVSRLKDGSITGVVYDPKEARLKK